MVSIRQNKGVKIILHANSPTIRAAKLKGFTVISGRLLHTSNFVGHMSYVSTPRVGHHDSKRVLLSLDCEKPARAIARSVPRKKLKSPSNAALART